MAQIVTKEQGIARDTLEGLTSEHKFLKSRYFYDDQGSRIFQDIMNMPEYYITDCELEIFQTQKEAILNAIGSFEKPFQLVELGSGDGLKTKVLLAHFLEKQIGFMYLPVDISDHANEVLKQSLKKSLPQLAIDPQTGDYFEILEKLHLQDGYPRVVFFLGANIGNFTQNESFVFLSKIARFTDPGDKIMVGFDLKKSPQVIMDAYSDPHGHTSRFNFNHLIRLNRELGANFNIDNFEHQTNYNPVTGSVKSFLISKKDHYVKIDSLDIRVHFQKWEPLFMELSQKYNFHEIETLAHKCGFRVTHNFTDSKGFFVDSLWKRV